MNSPRSSPPNDVVAGALGVDNFSLERGGVEFEAVSAEALGAIEGKSALTSKRCRSTAAPNAPAMPMLIPSGTRGPRARSACDALDDVAREFVEADHVLVGIANDDEFVAAGAGDEVAGAQISPNRLRGVNQHRVAGGMTERVVDLLEAVEIDMQQRDAAAGSRRSGQRAPPSARSRYIRLGSRVRKS